MNENTKKRREWIKNAAIVFLVIMLILTFFSNTIMNYSLPEVAHTDRNIRFHHGEDPRHRKCGGRRAV